MFLVQFYLEVDLAYYTCSIHQCRMDSQLIRCCEYTFIFVCAFCDDDLHIIIVGFSQIAKYVFANVCKYC